MVLAPQNGQRPFQWNVFWSPLGAGMKHTGDCATEGGLGALHTFLIPYALLPPAASTMYFLEYSSSPPPILFLASAESLVFIVVYIYQQNQTILLHAPVK